jgi:hypothetical protein
VAVRAPEVMTGRDSHQAIDDQELPDMAEELPVPEPTGDGWDFDDLDQMRSGYPRLWSQVHQLYGEDPESAIESLEVV